MSVAVSAFGEIGAKGGTGSVVSRVVGIAFALGAVLSYGLVYVLVNVEYGKDNAICPSAICFLLSLLECGVNFVYMCFVVIPNWHQWVVSPMRDNDRSATYIVLVYLSLVVVDGLHQIGFFHCLSFGKVAAVTSGVNKAAQAVGLFIFSDMLFCGDDEDQCLNVWKLVGTVGVCICVLTYTGDKHIRSLLGYGDGDNSVKCTRAICERATEERDKHGMPVVSYTGLEEDSARSDDTGAGPAVAAVKRRDGASYRKV